MIIRRGVGGVSIVASLLFVGCGTLGAPVPPEYVGVGPLIEKQRMKEKQAAEAKQQAERDRTFSAEEATNDPRVIESGVIPPPLYPVDTR